MRRAQVEALARAAGFHACGVAAADSVPGFESRLRAWVDDGCAADMGYMKERMAMRGDPRMLVQGARSVVSCLLAYKPSRAMHGTHRLARYAYGEDYHLRMKGMLLRLLRDIRALYPDVEGRAFVDTAPISDKEWAVRAGLGWRGKNTLLVHPLYGSYVFLGELVLTAACDGYATPLASPSCGDCQRCVQACPNHAIALHGGRYRIDARRCNSYHTIENRSDVLPSGLNLAGYAFGCDCCQEACPYNQSAPATQQVSEDELARLEALWQADEDAFRRARKGSALARIKYAQWRRNIGE